MVDIGPFARCDGVVDYALRRGSGGAGPAAIAWCARSMLEAMQYTLITEHRRRAPAGGETEPLAPKVGGDLGPGDRLRLETPGGGGCGADR